MVNTDTEKELTRRRRNYCTYFIFSVFETGNSEDYKIELTADLITKGKNTQNNRIKKNKAITSQTQRDIKSRIEYNNQHQNSVLKNDRSF